MPNATGQSSPGPSTNKKPSRSRPAGGPSADRPDTRTRIRTASAELFARRGYAGTGLKQVASEAQAPFGSIYHFFPGGKDDLAEDMMRTTGPQFMQLVLDTLAERDDPGEALEHTLTAAADNLIATDYADGCPIATMALDVASTNEQLRLAASDVFAQWLDGGTTWFSRYVDDPERARDLAYTLIMLIEGAFLLSRTARDPEPLYAAGRTMAALMRAEPRRTHPGPG